MNFKDIHIGQMIEKRVTESEIEMSRLCNFFKYTEKEIIDVYSLKTLDTELLLKWCKVLEYDFFRVFSQHLILYAPVAGDFKKQKNKTTLPSFRKNIYTIEVIIFILDQIKKGNKTKKQVIEEYKIPKTTLYKWISKFET